MEPSDVLLYILCLLSTLESGFYSPQGMNSSWQHALDMYGYYLCLKEKESNSSRRQCWVRPIFTVERRNAQGASKNLVAEMSNRDHQKFLEYLRMTKQDFSKLLIKIRPYITKQYVVRKPISARTRLHICLRFLASGDSIRSISFSFRVAHNTVSTIISETCSAIWKCLRKEAFPNLSTALWHEHANQFEERWNFPHCIGAVDGKQVVLQGPANTGSTYFNYKNSFGMNLMAIADSHYRFIVVDIGAPGRRSDGGVFNESKMFRQFESNSFNVPISDPIYENGPTFPYVLVGDEAFGATTYLMTPYRRRNVLSLKQKVFNYRLSRSRRVVESAFGILSARWRVYRNPMRTSIKVTRKVIQATCCLHNWLITQSINNHNEHDLNRYSHLTPEDRNITSNGLQEIPQMNNRNLQNNLSSNVIREKFTDYFMSVGALQFQWEKILNNDF